MQMPLCVPHSRYYKHFSIKVCFCFLIKKQIHTLSKTHFASDKFDTYIAKRLIKVNSIPDSNNTTCTPFVTMLFIMKGRRRQIASGAANASHDLF